MAQILQNSYKIVNLRAIFPINSASYNLSVHFIFKVPYYHTFQVQLGGYLYIVSASKLFLSGEILIEYQ